MNPLDIAGLGLGFIGSLGQLFGVGKANKRLTQLEGQDPTYTENPLAKERLGLAQTMLNARMPGAAQETRNIFSNQANTVNNYQRGAGDASQLLALASGAQGQTNQALGNLGLQETQDYQRRYENYNNAAQGQINEGDKAYNDQVRKYGDLVSMEGAKAKNRSNAWGSLSNMGFGLASLGMSGVNPFGGGAGKVAGAGMPLATAQPINTGFYPALTGGNYINPQMNVPQYTGWSYQNPYGE